MNIGVHNYIRLIPECSHVREDESVDSRNTYLPCFDFIYDSVPLSKNDYPYGVIISNADANDIFKSLYNDWSDVTYDKRYGSGPYTIQDTSYDAGVEYPVLPLFYVMDKNGNPVNVENVKPKWFNNFVERYKDMNASFKPVSEGFFMIPESPFRLDQIVSEITPHTHRRLEKHKGSPYEYVIKNGLTNLYIHFLSNDEIIEKFHDSTLYEFADKYLLYWGKSNRIEYLYDTDFNLLVEESGGVVEPLYILETELGVTQNYDSVPRLQYHSIFFNTRTQYRSFMFDIIDNNSLNPEVVSFFSTECDDSLNQFIKNNQSLIIEEDIDIRINNAISKGNTNRVVDQEYSIRLNMLKNNTAFIKKSIENDYLTALNFSLYIIGVGFIQAESNEMFGVDPLFFSYLKVSKKDISRISTVYINKYMLDSKTNDSDAIPIIDYIYKKGGH